MYATTTFVRVDNNRTVTRQTDPEFYFEFQRGVLLSLKERGMLTEMQLTYAEAALREQCRAIIQQEGEKT